MAHPTRSRIWVQLLTTIACALVCVWIGVIVWQGYASRKAALAQARISASACTTPPWPA